MALKSHSKQGGGSNPKTGFHHETCAFLSLLLHAMAAVEERPVSELPALRLRITSLETGALAVATAMTGSTNTGLSLCPSVRGFIQTDLLQLRGF